MLHNPRVPPQPTRQLLLQCFDVLAGRPSNQSLLRYFERRGGYATYRPATYHKHMVTLLRCFDDGVGPMRQLFLRCFDVQVTSPRLAFNCSCGVSKEAPERCAAILDHTTSLWLIITMNGMLSLDQSPKGGRDFGLVFNPIFKEEVEIKNQKEKIQKKTKRSIATSRLEVALSRPFVNFVPSCHIKNRRDRASTSSPDPRQRV